MYHPAAPRPRCAAAAAAGLPPARAPLPLLLMLLLAGGAGAAGDPGGGGWCPAVDVAARADQVARALAEDATIEAPAAEGAGSAALLQTKADVWLRPEAPSATTVAPTTPQAQAQTECVRAWGQCGGVSYKNGSGEPFGPLCCMPDYECVATSRYYSQCRPLREEEEDSDGGAQASGGEPKKGGSNGVPGAVEGRSGAAGAGSEEVEGAPNGTSGGDQGSEGGGAEGSDAKAQATKGGAWRALLVFLAALAVLWVLFRDDRRNAGAAAGGAAGAGAAVAAGAATAAATAWHRRLASQVWALSWKNAKVSSRTEVPCCTCCSTCCVLILAPVIYVTLLTVVPDSIMHATQLSDDVVIEHPVEFGRNYTSGAVWAAQGRALQDYLFQAPTVSEATGGVPGYPPLWHNMFKNNAPAGACYCRTLAVVGPQAKYFKTYAQKRHGRWQSDFLRRHGNPSVMDTVVEQHECPAKNKASLFRVFETEDDVSQWIEDMSYGEVNPSRGENGTLDRICGVVVFENDVRSTSVPKFVIRTNITGSDITGTVGTKRVTHEQQGLVQQSRSFYWYLQSGFLSIQELVEDFIVESRMGMPEAWTHKDFVPLPTDPFTENIFTKALGGMVASPMTSTIMNAATIMCTAAFMIKERNARQKELMRLMGLFDSSLSLSWLTLFAAVNVVATLGCTMLIYASFVERSNPTVLAALIFLTSMATTALGMICSTLISTERLGSLFAFGVYNIIALAYLVLTVSSDGDDGSGQQGFGMEVSESVGTGQLMFFSLVPQVAFTLTLQTYLGLDEVGRPGCHWSSLFETYKKYSVGGGLCMLMLDFFLAGLLYLYLEQVVQHDVGLARPWYFPLQASFWREVFGHSGDDAASLGAGATLLGAPASGGGGGAAAAPSGGEFFEDEESEQLQQMRSRDLVVSVQGLHKTFINASGVAVHAVNGLNLTMYQGECFCLLGHNGAGKSTTMAILTGMLPQSAGTVQVYGHRLPEARNEVRRQMGFCMQQNVLWDTLTVEEHIHLFGALMGLSPELIASSCDEVLRKVDLLAKRHAEANALSGGMKRKLNVALALLGRARILFLDEPTAGMDPHTRRQLWEMLKQIRAERIVCLTTHYMDEADELGDRICIMVSGRAACCGTNAFLKHKLGCGYMLNFVKAREDVRNEPVVALVRRHCGEDVGEASEVGRELRLRVPFAGAAAFPQLMQRLDADLGALGLESYGVGVSDLEDVFLKVASGHVPGDGDDVGVGAHNSVHTLHTLPPTSPSSAPASPTGSSAAAAAAAAAPAAAVAPAVAAAGGGGGGRKEAGFGRQLKGLFQRRVRYGWRDSRMFFCQLLLPVFNMVVFLFVERYSMSFNFALDYPQIPLDTAGWNAPTSVGFGPTLVTVGISAEGMSGDSLIGETWARQPPPGVTRALVNDSLQLDAYGNRAPDVPSADETHRERLISEMAFADFAYAAAHGSGGAAQQIGGLLYAGDSLTLFPNTSAYFSAPALLNLHYSAMIEAISPFEAAMGSGTTPLERIEVSSKPLEASSIETQLVQTFNGFWMGLVVMCAYSFIPSGIAAYVAMEKELEVRHQLMVSGTGRLAYWLSNFAFDICFGIVSSVGTLLVFAGVGAHQWLDAPNIQATLALLVLFTPTAAIWGYFWSLFFSSASSTLSALLILNMIGGTFAHNVSSVLVLFTKTRSIGFAIEWAVRFLFPTACLGGGLMKLAINKNFIDKLQLSPFTGQVFGNCFAVAGMDKLPPVCNAGDDVFMLALDLVVYAVLLFVVDYFGEHGWVGRVLRGAAKCPGEQRLEEEEEVAAEKARVRSLDPASQVLLLDDVHKTYNGKTFAVRGISYGVKAGQVFGLLGVNGAGKTTTFKMMCGQLAPSSGRILVGGKDVAEDLEEVRKLIGYCPQFNALLDLLTIREHLELYGQIKGLSGAELEADIQDKIQTFDMGKFEHTRASQLSGGNMRKLSCALAMVGEPPIIFLDEPSAGMDPVARRFMWDVIQDIAQKRKDSAVVLTTHSMEEADALCSRIAIQASGQVRCLGTPQQLKERHGAGLELNVRLGAPERSCVLEVCEQWDLSVEDTCDAPEARRLLAARAAPGGGAGAAALELPDGADFAVAALAEWCLVQEQADKVAQFLRKSCGHDSVSCVEKTGRSLSFRLRGSCIGGGPLPYGQLFGLLEAGREELGLADFQLSQGTLERTFNRLAAEDLERTVAGSSPFTRTVSSDAVAGVPGRQVS